MGIINYVVCRSGGMADAHGSGPCVGNNMRVQVPSPALDFIQCNVSKLIALLGHIYAEVSELADEHD